MAKENDAPARIAVSVLTVVMLETGQLEISGPMQDPDLVLQMLDGARQLVKQIEIRRRLLKPGQVPANLKS